MTALLLTAFVCCAAGYICGVAHERSRWPDDLDELYRDVLTAR